MVEIGFADDRFGKAMMDHEVDETHPVVTRTSSVRELVVGLDRRFRLWLHRPLKSSKGNHGQVDDGSSVRTRGP